MKILTETELLKMKTLAWKRNDNEKQNDNILMVLWPLLMKK